MKNPIVFRRATKEDLVEIVALLANDDLGKLREDNSIPLSEKYEAAFARIIADKNQELMVIESDSQQLIGTL